MPIARVSVDHGAIVHDAERLPDVSTADFDPVDLARRELIRATAKGRGNAWFVAVSATAQEQHVVRHFRRGGLIARLLGDRYFWTGAVRTRAFREFDLLVHLESLGLPAARPVAARYERQGLWYRADLRTVAIAGARTLASLLLEDPDLDVWRRVGQTVRRFHDAGIFHADLNAHNVLVDPAGVVHLVDFDRGRRRAPGRWRNANLRRLHRSLVKVGADRTPAAIHAAWAALLDGYGVPRGRPPR
jgi:3-deoxy-D-manno-octulosonic acid kinase